MSKAENFFANKNITLRLTSKEMFLLLLFAFGNLRAVRSTTFKKKTKRKNDINPNNLNIYRIIKSLPPSSAQNSLPSLLSKTSGAFFGARRREACLASPVLLAPHQTTGLEENSMKTPLESKLLDRAGRSTAFDVYGVDPNTLTRYFSGAETRRAKH